MRLLVLLFMLVWAACSNPQEQTAQRQTAPAPLAITANDDEQRNKFRTEMQAHLDAENFTELNRIARELNTTKERFPGGDWKLDRFFEAIGGTPEGPDPVQEPVDYETRIARLAKWTD
jgi:hypothetical protein